MTVPDIFDLATPVGHGVSVVGLIGKRALACPEAVACQDAHRSLTYGEVDRASARLAAALHQAGVRRESVVGVLLPRSVDLVVTLLAILRAGGAYLPLEPDHPTERLAFLLADSGARLLVHSPATRAAAASLDGVTRLDIAASIDLADPSPALPAPQPHDAAYVIYTSGTTGRPKGVVVEHRNLGTFTSTIIDLFDYGDRATASALGSIAFDAFGLEVWPALASGSKVWLGPDLRTVTVAELAEALRGAYVTHCFVPTVIAEELATALADAPGALRVLLTGGEQLVVRPHRRPFRFVNCYGPTEGTVMVSATDIADNHSGPVPLGWPLPGTQLYVLDRHGRRLEVGEVGELYIGGAGVARGYISDPELTEQRFVPDPFSTAPGARLYRTGDLVSRRVSGELDFHGRADRQIKIRGYRVEPEEVEAVLTALPGVHQAAVLATSHASDASPDHLVAFITGPASLDQLRAAAAERLPAYLIPTQILVLPDLPRTTAGKRDYHALRALLTTHPDGPTDPPTHPTDPDDPLLTHLHRHWTDVLGHHNFGPDDNFFTIGGDSLAAIRLSGLLQASGYPMTVQQAFEHHTLRQQLALLRRKAG